MSLKTRIKENRKDIAIYAAFMLALTLWLVLLIVGAAEGYFEEAFDQIAPFFLILWFISLVIGPYATLAEGGHKGWFTRNWKLLSYFAGLMLITLLGWETISFVYIGAGMLWLFVASVLYGRKPDGQTSRLSRHNETSDTGSYEFAHPYTSYRGYDVGLPNDSHY